MKNINSYCAEKYESAMTGKLVKELPYERVEEGVYKSAEDDGCFVTSLSFEQEPELGEGENAANISQYPLEDLLDKFYCHVSDFYEEMNTADSPVCYLEFAAFDLEDIQGLRSVIGKHVYNKENERNGNVYVDLIIE